MANTKISQLTALTNPTGNEEFVYALNNANGKVTLDTMKTYTQTWTQEELVSWTNIKTINGQSILWSWNMVISWGGWTWEDNDYDAVVDVNGGWDYTSISDAITAGIRRMFVKNWTYTMSQSTLSAWDFKLVWESKEWVKINITFPTRSWKIFTLTSNTTDKSHSWFISNVTFNITYTWEYGYFVLFDIPDNWFLTLTDCNVCVVSATNGCNFYLCDASWQMNAESCYIEVLPTTWNPQWLWFQWMNRQSACTNSTIVVDADPSIWTTWLKFTATPQWAYVGCQFNIWQTHATQWDDIEMWAESWFSCRYTASTYATVKISWRQTNCVIGWIGANANYDSDLNTAVTSKKISIWKPSTSYSVWDYVMSWKSTTLAKCIEAHTSWATFDSTKFTDTYWDMCIQAGLSQCTIKAWGSVILTWVAGYNDTIVQPASLIDMSDNIFFCDKPSSSLSVNYCNFILLSNRWFNYNTITWGSWLNKPVNIYIWWESSTLCWNRIVASTWEIYSWWYGNIITNNIFTYITWQTTPTITQVASWLSEIANNVIRWVADWNS